MGWLQFIRYNSISSPNGHDRTRKLYLAKNRTVREDYGTAMQIFLSLNQNRVGVKSMFGKTMLREETSWKNYSNQHLQNKSNMKNSKITRDQMYLIVWYGRTIIVENSSDKKLRTTNVLLFLLSFPSRATTTTYVFTTHKQNYVLFLSVGTCFKAF